ncbi:hypothetical protein [Clostridium butyricum]|uniref:Uncharacterized protein n=1 Tax=Clostridium butyricum E4 str. BoNT E BL5262 TaxID=632245 RepID=C4IGV0_CLOBU|nr:hypothetical protein [Clostridium butyricum]EDT74770.1 conserved hypothetical protein [Clostridium butyricum 5521]EEP54607.1 hypothetical protein CLP_2644 [Clostridium butyricum E4 str. BoNT E BL5262]
MGKKVSITDYEKILEENKRLKKFINHLKEVINNCDIKDEFYGKNIDK